MKRYRGGAAGVKKYQRQVTGFGDQGSSPFCISLGRRMTAYDAVNGPSTGARVPSHWVLSAGPTIRPRWATAMLALLCHPQKLSK